MAHNNQQHPPLVDELHALVDERLDAAQAGALQAQVDANPELARTLQAWREQRRDLRALHVDALDEAIPPALLDAASGSGKRQAASAQWWRWGGIAASVAMAFITGWAAHGQWSNSDSRVAGGSAEGRFAHQAVVAHVVYSPEVRHPVEVAAAQQEHLVQWLSKRLGRPLKVPVLTPQGYELVGGRLLPGEDGARAQFMYQNTGGERLTLYVGAIKAGSGENAAKETAFRYLDDGSVPSFYWVDQGFGYALAGKLARPALLKLATAVYQQL